MENEITYNIRKIIAQKGMVQGVVADRAGFTRQQFSDMLTCRKTLKAEYVPRIARALGVSVSNIYDIESEPLNLGR